MTCQVHGARWPSQPSSSQPHPSSSQLHPSAHIALFIVQEHAYEALLEAWSSAGEGWWLGVFWWLWRTDPTAVCLQ